MLDSAAAITAALLDEEVRRLRTPLVFDRFCRLLREAGVPLDRANLSLRQLHPQLVARSYHWDSTSGGAATVDRPHSVMTAADFLASPLAALFRDGQPIRRRLCEADCPRDFEILTELEAQGYRDYRVTPLLFTGRQINSLSVATRRGGGFSEPQLGLVDACVPALAAVVEIQQLRDTARTLLTTYVGARSGAKVWEGSIRRGQTEPIYAIVLLCDLRGFTQLAAGQPLAETIDLLNDYFDAVGAALAREGGEILKFMGDAVLAIFPCDPQAERDCRKAAAALAAAEEGLNALARLNESRHAAGRPPIAAGMALAVGEVLYGNIGVADRLDFTVIGPAVNLVSRLQGLTHPLGEPILLSEEVTRRLPRDSRSCGRHRLKGVSGEVEVFAPGRRQA